jgi:hypothetical protein
MDMLDESAVTRFVQETVAQPDIDVVGLSCVLQLAEFDDESAGPDAPVTRDVVLIYLVSKDRETWVANDIDTSAGRLMRGALDLTPRQQHLHHNAHAALISGDDRHPASQHAGPAIADAQASLRNRPTAVPHLRHR